MKKKKKKKIVKKKLTKLEQLRKAKIKTKTLHDYKKLKDKKFRSEAEKESFVTSTTLNAEMRQNTRIKKSSKGTIQAQKNKIKQLQKENLKISRKRSQLEKEYEFSDPERKREIEKLFAKADYKKKDLFVDKNVLKQLEGKDFDYIVNDGFEKYKINTKELKKYWKKGEDASLPILKKMKSDAEQAIKHFKKLIKKEKNTATKARMKKLKRILIGLEDKLKHTIEKNIEAIETGDMKVLDELNDEGEKAYSILFRVVGFSIDRIGI